MTGKSPVMTELRRKTAANKTMIVPSLKDVSSSVVIAGLDPAIHVPVHPQHSKHSYDAARLYAFTPPGLT
jgi:hypothetical protein